MLYGYVVRLCVRQRDLIHTIVGKVRTNAPTYSRTRIDNHYVFQNGRARRGLPREIVGLFRWNTSLFYSVHCTPT